MTSTHRSEQGDGSSKTFAENIQNMATQKPPPPEGKGIVMVVLAVVVVIAALYQFLTGSGAGQVIRENHENEPKPRTAAAGPEASTSAAATPASAPDREPDRQPARRPIEVFDPTERPVEVPVGVPGADLKIPEGIDARTAGALRLSLNALRPGPLTSKLVKEDALRHMGTVIDGAPEASKERARTFLLEQLAPYVRSYAIGGRVLDAALEIAGDDASALFATTGYPR